MEDNMINDIKFRIKSMKRANARVNNKGHIALVHQDAFEKALTELEGYITFLERNPRVEQLTKDFELQ